MVAAPDAARTVDKEPAVHRCRFPLFLALAVAMTGCTQTPDQTTAPTGVGDVGRESDSVAAVPADLQQGNDLYQQYCSGCHGPDANGSDKGPPFLNAVYAAGHHPDQAFVVAAQLGVRAHHWQFGDMPPVEGIKQAEVDEIVKYVRYLQDQVSSAP